MQIRNSFQELIELRKKIGASEINETFGKKLDDFKEIEIQLSNEGIEVNRDQIVPIGPILTYQGQTQAILYIYDTKRPSDKLLDMDVMAQKPKFHFSWCITLEKMQQRNRFARYIMSRKTINQFKVQALEREPHLIKKYGKNHILEDITLYACKNCLKETNYNNYEVITSNPERNDAVKRFSIKSYFDEHAGTLSTIRFRTKYTDKNVPFMEYTKMFTRIARELKIKNNWMCTKCNVDMTNKKEGLHAHHINGDISDNSLQNLKILCALCHKNIDTFHKNMHVKPEIERFILSNRN